jgi:DNA processing protein
VSAVLACASCLRRTWLVAELAGSIEIARRERRPLREILSLADERLIAAVGGHRGPAIAEALERLDIDALRAAVDDSGLDAVCRHQVEYPDRLRDLDDAPALVLIAGDVERLTALAGGRLEQGPRAVAVVGTRRASPDGLEIARALGRGLAGAGVTVVSGMAFGIDSAAHAGALEAGGRTIAVLAGGSDVPYPLSKRRLYEAIVENGCVVGEMPPGFAAMRWCFPARNRTIAALGQMTIVVEAARRSGSLITAEIASDIGREVGAVPGPVMAWHAAGTNALLRDGATLVRDARDALDAVVGVDCHLLEPQLEPRLRDVLRAVSDGHDTLGALAWRPGKTSATLAALTELELLGHLRRAAGGRYVLVPP